MKRYRQFLAGGLKLSHELQTTIYLYGQHFKGRFFDEFHPQYHALITKFKELTGCLIVENTSFNVRGEPIVCSPEDAFHCFMGTGSELRVIGNVILHKKTRPGP